MTVHSGYSEVIDLRSLTHQVSTRQDDDGYSIRCEGFGCHFTAKSLAFGSREAARLGHAHIAYPECTLLELLEGPPCEGRR